MDPTDPRTRPIGQPPIGMALALFGLDQAARLLIPDEYPGIMLPFPFSDLVRLEPKPKQRRKVKPKRRARREAARELRRRSWARRSVREIERLLACCGPRRCRRLRNQIARLAGPVRL